MIPLIKPSGVKVYVNENSLSHALSLGWKHETVQVTVQDTDQVKQETPKKRGRPFKSV
jgi:hypothetical protein